MFGILGAPDVDWAIAPDGGRIGAAPGSSVSAMVSLRPHQTIDARRVMAALVGTEDYQYREREIRATGSSSNRTWGSSEIGRQEIQLLGPGQISAGELRSGPVAFTVPATALPSFESGILRVRWKLIAWIDVGGRDPRFEQPIVVPLTGAQLDPADAAAMGPQVQTAIENQPVSFWAQPSPIRAGAGFSGAVDVMTPLTLSDARVELKLNVATQMGGGIPGATLLAIAGLASNAEDGVSDSRILWQGTLTDGGPAGAWHRYLYAGQLPNGPVVGPVVTAVFPHGAATATMDVVISRRLRPDVHITRPVAIVSG